MEPVKSKHYSLAMQRWVSRGGNNIGWVTVSGKDENPVLILHGNAGNALGRDMLADKLREAGADGKIYIVDYPGFGSATGSPTQTSLTDAAAVALDALPGGVVVVGESLGTGVAAQLAKRSPNKIRGLLLITPFDSMVSAASHGAPIFPVKLLLLDRFDSVEALNGFTRPVGIIVAGADTIIPSGSGDKLFASLNGKKELCNVPGAGHNRAAFELPMDEWKKLWRLVSADSP